jgi:hypothetical protein
MAMMMSSSVAAANYWPMMIRFVGGLPRRIANLDQFSLASVFATAGDAAGIKAMAYIGAADYASRSAP